MGVGVGRVGVWNCFCGRFCWGVGVRWVYGEGVGWGGGMGGGWVGVMVISDLVFSVLDVWYYEW